MNFFLFAYFCAESCRHTGHRDRYLRNLLLFGLLSEIPFQLIIDIPDGKPLELRFALLLGALARYVLCTPLLLRAYRGERGRSMKYFFYFFIRCILCC